MLWEVQSFVIWNKQFQLNPNLEAKIKGAQSMDHVSTRLMLNSAKTNVKTIKLNLVNQVSDLKVHLGHVIKYLESHDKLIELDEWTKLSHLISIKKCEQ